MKPHFILISDLRMACPIWRILCQLRKSHLKVFQHRNVEKFYQIGTIRLSQSFLSQLDGSSKRRYIKMKGLMDTNHAKNYHGNDRMAHKCNQCEYNFSSASNLRAHLKIHTGQKSSKCNQCDFASSQAGHLRTHLRTHSREKPNKCNQCDYASSHASSLRTHLKMHSGEK